MKSRLLKIHLLEFEHLPEGNYLVSLKIPAKLYKKFRSFLMRMGVCDKRGAKNES